MADYTMLNLKDDVENMAERYGLAPDLETHFGRKALDVKGGGFSYQKLAPNFKAPTGHRHRAQEEVYIVLAGSGQAKVEDEEHDLRQWDVLRVEPQVARGFAAGPEGLELLAIGFGESGDAEMIEDFWEGDES